MRIWQKKIAKSRIFLLLKYIVKRLLYDRLKYEKFFLRLGETAEMPGVYRNEDYDIAGFAVGAVERDQILPRESEIRAGDVLIGLHSSGVHSNGFSLIRKIVDNMGLSYDEQCPFISSRGEKTLGEALLTPTKIYVKSLLPLMRTGEIKAFSHITGILMLRYQ